MRKLLLVSVLVLSLVGCASRSDVCLAPSQESLAQAVLSEGFSPSPWQRHKQWQALVQYMRCAYPAPSLSAVALLESVPGFFEAAQPEELKFLFDGPQQWRDKVMQWAQHRSDDAFERIVARSYEQAKELAKAHEIYIHIYRHKDKRAGHDIAFGLLHGWDGGLPDDHAAKFWYAKTYVETGLEKSLQACRMIEQRRNRRAKNQELAFCVDDYGRQ